MNKMLFGLVVGLFSAGSVFPPGARADQPRRYEAVEVRRATEGGARPYFFRAVAFLFRASELWVLDLEDNEVRVFSEAGQFLRALGRKGNGPGEFDMPTDMDVLGERVYVADGGNRRVQILDKKGAYLEGFKVGFFPRKILALGEDRIIVAHLPSGREGKEKMLHCFNRRGELLWEAFDSYFSGNSVFDTFRNDILLRRGEGGHFYVLGRSEEKNIFKLDSRGRQAEVIRVGEDYPLRKVAIPTGERGKRRELCAFFWNGDWHAGRFYLAIPDYRDRQDVKPGKEVAVVDETGRVEAFIHFPIPVSSLSVTQSGKRIFALDSQGELWIFEVSKAKAP